MDTEITGRHRALSHKEYLDTLQRPSVAEIRRISEIQLQKEHDISAKYHSAEEHDAAKLIQRAYRGHRERRQLNGLNLDPSSRWVEIIKEWKYRSATAPHLSSSSPNVRNRSESAADLARRNWYRATAIAEHAGAGESRTSLAMPTPESTRSNTRSSKRSKRSQSELEPPNSMLMDLRYFLEMVDQKHRYGANLQVYHEEWQRSKTDQNFFYWLDHGSGKDEDLAPICPREKLEKERIRYLSKEERRDYLVRVDEKGLLRWEKNDELITTSADLYRDSMKGIVPKDSTEPTFNDEDVKRQISADAGFSSKLAAVGSMFRDAIYEDENEERYDYEDSSTSSQSSSAPSTPSDEVLSPEQAVAHQRVTKDHTPGDPKPDDLTSTTNPPKKKKKKPLHVSPATILNSLLRASVRPGTWIYVTDTLQNLYIGIKSSGAFQHASFLSGARISSAGIIGIKDGKLEYLSPLSGHYRPTTKSFKVFVEGLKTQGVDMSSLKVSSAYQILLGMEYYGTTKKGMRKIFGKEEHEERKRRRKRERGVKVDQGTLETVQRIAVGTGVRSWDLSGTERVERNWEVEHERHPHLHRRGGGDEREELAGLMDDLHVRRLSDEGKNTPKR
ncbi:hypothetical protein PRZ48_001897 [Zasmidium cellare]|uniref:Uncharacterized protein n=1 Tax=Zasmidium cellare TaxID=395010 RepID=A0ABR0F2J2_ZASCE|nr:hypothetical protein PRZ48_001897 [Zasmidium cellare]